MEIKDRYLARAAKRSRIKSAVKNFLWEGIKAVRKLIMITTGIGGVQVFEGSLAFRVKRNGIWYNFGTVSHKVITTAFAEFVVDQLQTETSVFGDFKWHQIGTGSTAEGAAQTALVTPVETVTAGSQTEDSSKVYKSIASIAITAARALREHGIFNNETPASGTMMDRTLFDLINLDNGDTYEATYKLTVSDNT